MFSSLFLSYVSSGKYGMETGSDFWEASCRICVCTISSEFKQCSKLCTESNRRMTRKLLKKTDGRGQSWRRPNYENWIKVFFPSSLGWERTGVKSKVCFRAKKLHTRGCRRVNSNKAKSSSGVFRGSLRCSLLWLSNKHTTPLSCLFTLFQSKTSRQDASQKVQTNSNVGDAVGWLKQE